MSDRNDQPDSVAGFQQIVECARKNCHRIVVSGARTKQRLAGGQPAWIVSTKKYCGIVEHQASDFTISVRAGTPVRKVSEVLSSQGQFLPFDPVFADSGATVGGMVASGMNGPCRLRFGGVRDFVIGCQFIDGLGRAVRAGGKVVKNAAGFDLPKFLAGSAGRFGIILEMTFKVFPKPPCYQSLCTRPESAGESARLLGRMVHSRIDFDALEILEDHRVAARWSGDAQVCDAIRQQLAPLVTGQTEWMTGSADAAFWSELSNPGTALPGDWIVKVPISRAHIPALDHHLFQAGIARRFSVAGNLAVLRISGAEQLESLERILVQLHLTGQFVVGGPEHFLTGATTWRPFLQRIKSALDPERIFAPLSACSPGEVMP